MTGRTIMTADQLPETWEIARLVRVLREHLPDLAQRYHIRSLGVFGSYVCNEQALASDLDVLVEFEKLPGLLTYVGLQQELSNQLGVPVDLVHRPDLKPHIAARILEEVIML